MKSENEDLLKEINGLYPITQYDENTFIIDARREKNKPERLKWFFREPKTILIIRINPIYIYGIILLREILEVVPEPLKKILNKYGFSEKYAPIVYNIGDAIEVLDYYYFELLDIYQEKDEKKAISMKMKLEEKISRYIIY